MGKYDLKKHGLPVVEYGH